MYPRKLIYIQLFTAPVSLTLLMETLPMRWVEAVCGRKLEVVIRHCRTGGGLRVRGTAACLKYATRPGSCASRHWHTRRWMVRNCPRRKRPGCRRHRGYRPAGARHTWVGSPPGEMTGERQLGRHVDSCTLASSHVHP